MYENVFGNWAVHSFKCLFFAYSILLHLLLMHFHPAGSVVTGTWVLLRHHILQFPSADAASYPSSWQRYFKTDEAQTCGKKWAYYSIKKNTWPKASSERTTVELKAIPGCTQQRKRVYIDRGRTGRDHVLPLCLSAVHCYRGMFRINSYIGGPKW